MGAKDFIFATFRSLGSFLVVEKNLIGIGLEGERAFSRVSPSKNTEWSFLITQYAPFSSKVHLSLTGIPLKMLSRLLIQFRSSFLTTGRLPSDLKVPKMKSMAAICRVSARFKIE